MIGQHEPLLPYLFEIAAKPEVQGTVLAGGLGIRLKKEKVVSEGAVTVFDEIPELRATSDIDLLLRIGLWIEPNQAKAFREVLKNLDYKVILHSWHFQKPFHGSDSKRVKLDLQAREPLEDEQVKVKRKQVGKEMGTELAGYLTPEAFAVDDMPIEIEITHEGELASILVPHPYAWLNLKIAAAHDWMLELKGEIEPKFVLDADGNPTAIRTRVKHVSDVYALVGMMTGEELEQAEALADKYKDHPKAIEIRHAAAELYGSIASQGCQVISTHQGGAWREHLEVNYDRFWDALSQALGVGLAAAAPVIAADEEATADVEVKS